MKRPVLVILTAVFFSLISGGMLYAQETADSFFNRVSQRYESIEDYKADLVITKGETVQKAVVWYKNPNLLRLDFSDPEDMVLDVDGETLQVWVPEYSVTFSQKLRSGGQGQMTSLASSSGLELIKKYYTISYDPVPSQVPLDSDSSEMVVKLKATWKSSNEGFKRLQLCIDQDLLIRRISGITTDGEEVVFDFTNIEINNGIPETKFDYESPPSGNTIENFLFDPES